MTRRLTSLKHRIRRSLAEMDYAQRRSFEIRTGVPVTRLLNEQPTTLAAARRGRLPVLAERQRAVRWVPA